MDLVSPVVKGLKASLSDTRSTAAPNTVFSNPRIGLKALGPYGWRKLGRAVQR
jgi:hypothetical protein